MGIDYTFCLVYGFEMSDEEADAVFLRSEKDPGKFHMEDRFDPKTGKKLAPVKVWDVNPSTNTWYEIDGKKYDSDDMDPEELEKILAKKFKCNVDTFGSWPSGKLTKVFFVNEPINWKNADDYGRITVYNNVIELGDMEKLTKQALTLRDKLREAGYKVDDPSIFIAARIS